MGVGIKVNRFHFVDSDLADEGGGVDGDYRDEGNMFASVSSSICLETMAKLQRRHQFYRGILLFPFVDIERLDLMF